MSDEPANAIDPGFTKNAPDEYHTADVDTPLIIESPDGPITVSDFYGGLVPSATRTADRAAFLSELIEAHDQKTLAVLDLVADVLKGANAARIRDIVAEVVHLAQDEIAK